MMHTSAPDTPPVDFSTVSAAPISSWPLPWRRIWLTISEFPLAVFVLFATSMGFLTMLRYFAEIAYPLPDAGALLTVAGFITATAIVVALSLSLSLSAPLLILQMGDGIRPRWTDIAWAQIIPSLVFFLYAFLAPSWDSLGTPWNWGVVVYVSFVLIVLALGLKLFERTKNTPPSQRFKYLWLFCMCALSTTALAGGVNQLIQAMGGASESPRLP